MEVPGRQSDECSSLLQHEPAGQKRTSNIMTSKLIYSSGSCTVLRVFYHQGPFCLLSILACTCMKDMAANPELNKDQSIAYQDLKKEISLLLTRSQIFNHVD